MPAEIVLNNYLESIQQNYASATAAKDNAIWTKLKDHSVREFIEIWLETLSNNTRIAYQSSMRALSEMNLVNPEMNLQMFAMLNHELILDKIKLVSFWGEATRQSRAAAYISFAKFLCRRFKIMKPPIPNKEGWRKPKLKH